MLELGERVGIISAIGIVAYAVFQLFFSGNDPTQTRAGQVLALIDNNWKAALVIILPVFYRSIRALIGRVRQITAAGVNATFAETGEEPYKESLS
jgi:hypothetical protein